MHRNLPIPGRASLDSREPDADEDRLGTPRRLRADDPDDALEISVARRPNPLPLREAEAAELSEADILEEHDLEALDADDLVKMEGPDA